MENELFRKIVASLWKSQLLIISFFQHLEPLLHVLLPRLLDKLVASHIPAAAALSPELLDPGVPGRFCPRGAAWSAAAVHVLCPQCSPVCVPLHCTRQSQGCWLGKDHAGVGRVGSGTERIGSIQDQGESPSLELRRGARGVPSHPSRAHPKCLAFPLENKRS